MPFDLEALPPPEEDFEAEDFAAVPDDVLPPADFEAFPPLDLALEAALPVFEEADVLPVFDDLAAVAPPFEPADFDAPPAPFDFAPPELFDFAPVVFCSLSTSSPTASAATLRALTAAPVAAPIRISPATSVALSKKSGDDFRVDLLAVDFADFDEEAVDFEVFDDADFAGAALFAPVFDF